MVARVATLLVIALLVATGCTRNSTDQAIPSPISPGVVKWTSCAPRGFQCGTVQVPLDYAHPNAGTIEIALNRKPATDQSNRIGSVLVNPGGPGDSGIQFVQDDVAAMTNLNRRFDLIGFDPRGVGKSAPVHCLTGPEEDAFNAQDSVLDDPQEKQDGIQAIRNFAAACMQRSGKVLPFVDTPSAAKDMDLIRAALGDAKLTYLGFSYGTFLGETYAHLFPTHVRALALDGVVDPSLSTNELLLQYVTGFERNLQAFLADCNSRRTCQFAAAGDPATKLSALMDRLDHTPQPVGSRALTRSLAVTGIQAALFSTTLWPTLDQALAAADRGNGTILLLLADFLNGRNADGTYDNVIDANIAVSCLDRPAPTDISAYDNLGPAFASASPLFGPAFQYSNLACGLWPVKPTGHAGPLTANGAPPILLIGTTNDPATPYAWAQSVNRQLAGSVLLTRNGNGHTAYDSSACAHAATDDYLINLKLPAAGTVCSS